MGNIIENNNNQNEEKKIEARQDIVENTKSAGFEILEDSIQAVTTKNITAILEQQKTESWEMKMENLKGFYKINITSNKEVAIGETPQITITIKPDGKTNIRISNRASHYYSALNLSEEDAKKQSIIFNRIITENKLVEECEDILPGNRFQRIENILPDDMDFNPTEYGKIAKEFSQEEFDRLVKEKGVDAGAKYCDDIRIKNLKE